MEQEQFDNLCHYKVMNLSMSEILLQEASLVAISVGPVAHESIRSRTGLRIQLEVTVEAKSV